MGFLNECIHLDVLVSHLGRRTPSYFRIGSHINSATVWAIYLKWYLDHKSEIHRDLTLNLIGDTIFKDKLSNAVIKGNIEREKRNLVTYQEVLKYCARTD